MFLWLQFSLGEQEKEGKGVSGVGGSCCGLKGSGPLKQGLLWVCSESLFFKKNKSVGLCVRRRSVCGVADGGD